MNDVNWELIILIIVVALVVFAVLGIYIGTRISSDKKRIRELEDELSDTKKELEQYRSKVNNHFKKTSELFTQMTSAYKAVYLHLAEGSHELCSTDAALLNPPNDQFLKVTHEVKQPTAEEIPAQAVEKPAPIIKPPEKPYPVEEPPEKPEPAEAALSDSAPETEAEKPAEQEPEKAAQPESPPAAEEVHEEAVDTAEPVAAQEDKKDIETEKLRVVGS